MSVLRLVRLGRMLTESLANPHAPQKPLVRFGQARTIGAMADQTLLLMVSEIRGKTLRALDGVSEADALWAPPRTTNHILWHAGHAHVLAEGLVIAPASG